MVLVSEAIEPGFGISTIWYHCFETKALGISTVVDSGGPISGSTIEHPTTLKVRADARRRP